MKHTKSIEYLVQERRTINKRPTTHINLHC